MVSAVVTALTIAITYNGENPDSARHLAGAQADFVYYSAGTSSGITVVTAAACATDVLTLTGTFALPGNGASIVYTRSCVAHHVEPRGIATSDFPQFAATQTLALPLGHGTGDGVRGRERLDCCQSRSPTTRRVLPGNGCRRRLRVRLRFQYFLVARSAAAQRPVSC